MIRRSTFSAIRFGKYSKKTRKGNPRHFGMKVLLA